MMELRRLYIILLFSYVSATPYSFSTTSGASAKAGATGSVFGSPSAFPLSVPTGSGASGSFTKSSSSSFSASSSSASSSSSSFSFGSSGSTGVNALGVLGGTGCGLSRCQHHVPSLSTYSSGVSGITQGSSGVNTAATGTGSRDAGCLFGKCQLSRPSFVSGSDIVGKNHNYNSGIAGTGYATNTQGTTKFEANLEADHVNSDSNTHSSFGISDEKKPLINKDDQVLLHGCKNPSVQCNSNSEKQLITSVQFGANDVFAKTNEPEPSCKTPDCISQYTSVRPFDSKQPISVLQTPKEPASKPSSYDLPIHGGENTFSIDSPSTTHKYQDFPTQSTFSTKTPSKDCKTSKCVEQSSTHLGSTTDFGVPSTQQLGSKYPSSGLLSHDSPNEAQGNNPTKIFEYGYDTSTIPNVLYSAQTIPASGLSGTLGSIVPNNFNVDTGTVNAQSSESLSPKPDINGKPSNKKPIYNGGFGGPLGLLKPNDNIATTSGTSFSKPNVPQTIIDQKLPTYTGGFGGPSGILKPNEFDSTKPANTVGGSAPDIGVPTFTKPEISFKPLDQNIPTYTGSFLGQTGALKPNEFNIGQTSVHPKPVFHGEHNPFIKPAIDFKPLDEKLPTYTSGSSISSGSINSHESGSLKPTTNINNAAVSHTNIPDIKKPDIFAKPTNPNLPTNVASTSESTGTVQSSITSGNGIFSNNKQTNSKPITDVFPSNQKLPTYTGSFGTPAGAHPEHPSLNKPLHSDLKPTNEKLPTQIDKINVPLGSLKPNELQIKPSVSAKGPSSSSTKPNNQVKPQDQNIPTYTGGFGGPSGFLKPNEFDIPKTPVNVNSEAVAYPGNSDDTKPVTISKPIKQTSSTYSETSSGTTGAVHINEFNTPSLTVGLNTGLVSNTGQPSLSKPNSDIKPSNQKPTSNTNDFDRSKESLKPNDFVSGYQVTNANIASAVHQEQQPVINPATVDGKPANEKLPSYTGVFGGSSGSVRPDKFEVKPSINVNSEAAAHMDFIDEKKPFSLGKPSIQNPATYTGGFNVQTGSIKPTHNKWNSGQPTIDIQSGAFHHKGQTFVSKPGFDNKPSDQSFTTYTGGFGGPPGILNPNEFVTIKPFINTDSGATAHAGLSGIAKPVTVGKPNHSFVSVYPSVSGGFTGNLYQHSEHYSGNSNTGSLSHTKPSSQITPSYPSGFGTSSTTFKPNEITSINPSTNVNYVSVVNTGHLTDLKPVDQNPLRTPTDLVTHLNQVNIQKKTTVALLSTTEHSINAKPSEEEEKVSYNQSPTYSNSFSSSTDLSEPSKLDTGEQIVSQPFNQNFPTYTSGFDVSKGVDKIPTNINSFTGSFELQKPNENNTVTPSKINITPLSQTNVNSDRKPGSIEAYPTNTGIVSDTSISNEPHTHTRNPVNNYNSYTGSQTGVISSIKPSSGNIESKHKHPTLNSFSTPELPKPNKLSITTNVVTTANTVEPTSENPHQVQNQQAFNSMLSASPGLLKPSDAVNKPTISDVSSSNNIGSFGINSYGNTGKPGFFNDHQLPTNTYIQTHANSHINTNHEADAHSTEKLSTHSGAPVGFVGILKPGQFDITKNENYNKDKLSSQYSGIQKTDIGASSVTTAQTVGYSGGFGGPPGLLNPFDSGRLSSAIHGGKVSLGQSSITHGTSKIDAHSTGVNTPAKVGSGFSGFGTTTDHGSSTYHGFTNIDLGNTGSTSVLTPGHNDINKGIHAQYSKKTNEAVSGSQASTGIQSVTSTHVSASASATASAISSVSSSSDSKQDHLSHVTGNGQKTSGGCTDGCGGVGYAGGTNFDFNGGLSKTGYIGSWNSGLNAATASAKSITGALSGARAYSIGGSYGSSSASAHATSGYHTKGGY